MQVQTPDGKQLPSQAPRARQLTWQVMSSVQRSIGTRSSSSPGEATSALTDSSRATMLVAGAGLVRSTSCAGALSPEAFNLARPTIPITTIVASIYTIIHGFDIMHLPFKIRLPLNYLSSVGLTMTVMS
ncbi:MAG: hypothetical protein E6J90_20960 [Deltaproteobacteria bacterium]|nr:MAG: hypothetical protein E6J90_20960 [Deltaproteobacteria bacterium]